jgi:hypothetical protein
MSPDSLRLYGKSRSFLSDYGFEGSSGKIKESNVAALSHSKRVDTNPQEIVSSAGLIPCLVRFRTLLFFVRMNLTRTIDS